MHVPRIEGTGRGRIVNGRHASILPRASNHAFWLKTGVKPHMLLDMKGDAQFEVVIKDACGSVLAEDGQRVTIKMVR